MMAGSGTPTLGGRENGSDSRPTRSTTPIRCGGCTTEWTGLNTAHCAACHHTFSSPSAFDKHRRSFACLDPATAGLVDAGRGYPCWGLPGDRPVATLRGEAG